MNLSVTRGLVWLEDKHYNATKGNCQSTGKPSQTQHTFTWDNLAFDGPSTSRDFSYDALDALVPHSDGSVDLAKYAAPNQTTSWNVFNMPSNPQAAAARVYLTSSLQIPRQRTISWLPLTAISTVAVGMVYRPLRRIGTLAQWRT